MEGQPCRTPEAGFLSVPILVTSIHVVVLRAVVHMTNLRLEEAVGLWQCGGIESEEDLCKMCWQKKVGHDSGAKSFKASHSLIDHIFPSILLLLPVTHAIALQMHDPILLFYESPMYGSTAF